MSHDNDNGNGNGSAAVPTPPAYVRQLEQGQHEIYQRHSSLKSVVNANHMAVTHQLGMLAVGLAETNALLGELVVKVANQGESLKILVEMVKRLLPENK